jgi:hypothetical protein
MIAKEKTYMGWRISFAKSRPVTGTWAAESFGIRLSAGSEEAVKRMVNNRISQYPPDGHGGCHFQPIRDE